MVKKITKAIGDDDRARAIESREPCQMGNQAAISGFFDVLWIYSVGAFFFIILPLCLRRRRGTLKLGGVCSGVSGDLQKMAAAGI